MEFRDFQVGWILIPNVATPSHTRIGSISGNTITVSGDLTDLASAGDRFRIIAPVGAEQDTGEAALDVWKDSSRYLWSGYMYEPPLLGYEQSGTTYRRALGPDGDVATYDDNRAGSYYCWNRTYDPSTGRWTTPDPAVQYPNLQDYAGANPVSRSDPSGLLDWWDDWLKSHNDDYGEKDPSSTFDVNCGRLRWENIKKTAGYGWLGGQSSAAEYGFRVTFEPDGNCCCTSIRFVQMVRLRTEGQINTEYNGDFSGDAHFDDEGWRIDNAPGGSPYYPGKIGNSSPSLRRTKDAVMEDTPSTNLQYGLFGVRTWSSVEMEFVTCALCQDGGEIYGCVKFAIKFRIEPFHGPVVWLSNGPFLRTTSKDWWNNDKTVKAWNEAANADDEIDSLPTGT